MLSGSELLSAQIFFFFFENPTDLAFYAADKQHQLKTAIDLCLHILYFERYVPVENDVAFL